MSNGTLKVLSAAASLLFACQANVAIAQAQPPKPPVKPSAPLVDRISTSFEGECTETQPNDIQFPITINWSDSSTAPLYTAVKKQSNSCTLLPDRGTYIFHVMRWKGKPPNGTTPYVLQGSEWYVYNDDLKKKTLVRAALDAAGQPIIYGAKHIIIVGIDITDDRSAGAVKVTYKSSVTPGKAANVQNLSSLISALLGITVPSPTKGTNLSCSVKVAVSCAETSESLPYDVNVAATVSIPDADGKVKDSNTTPKDSSAPQSTAIAGSVDCPPLDTGGACSFKRTFTNLDREWWDVSIGVTTPGVRETQFSIANNTLLAKPTTHTDLYAMFDLFPFAARYGKYSALPHLNLGLPVTGKTFYRPYFGFAENITGWTKLERHGFPIPLNLFVGVVYMKTTSVTGIPTTAADLQAHSTSKRVLKPLIGIEVPISAIISKIGKGSSKTSK